MSSTYGQVTDERPAAIARPWLAMCLLALLLGIAVLYRVDGLNNLPGINGDEAWMGGQAEALLNNEPVMWRTPTGNVINPFHFGPQVALHLLGEPSIARLRFTALVSGLLAIGLNFYFARRLFNLPVAVVSSALLTLLPVNIAYARFGWDASQSVLFTLPVVYGSLLALKTGQTRYWLLAGGSLAAALLVHPTNIFIAPMLIVPAAAAMFEAKSSRRQRLIGIAAASGVGVGLAAGFGLGKWLGIAAERAVDPAQWGLFSVLFLDFVSGTTIYRFISGATPSEPVVVAGRWIALALLAASVVGGLRQWKGRESASGALFGPLLLGYALSLIGFFLIAGPEAIQPHFERYAICLVAGLAPIIAIGITPWLWSERRADSAWPRFAALSIATLWLLMFHLHYFGELQATGGANAHVAFRTGTIDPKQAVLEEIVAQRLHDEPILIVAPQWWSYWPLKYLAYRYDNVTVQETSTPQVTANEYPGGIWMVDFVDGEAVMIPVDDHSPGHAITEQWTANDFAGRPVVRAVRQVAP